MLLRSRRFMGLDPAPSQSLCLFAHISLMNVNDGGGGRRGLWRRVSAVATDM